MQGGHKALLQYFYNYDSDEDTKINTKNGLDSASDRRPFARWNEEPKCPLIRTRKKPSTVPSGFQPCVAILPKESIRPNDVAYVCEEFTDSELISCCLQVENMISTASDKGLQLVNSILEDFALSPLKENYEESTKFWEYSPQFVLQSKPRITYSSRRRGNKRSDCCKCLNFSFKEECHNNSTLISVQDERTELGEVLTSTAACDNTEKVYENLLNLSAHFTQTCPTRNNNHADAPDTCEHRLEGQEIHIWDRATNVGEVQGISETNSEGERNDNSNTSDFIGFPESDTCPDTTDESILQDDRHKISDVTFVCKSSSPSPNEDREYYHVLDKKDQQDDQLDERNKNRSESFALKETPFYNCVKSMKAIDNVDESKEGMNLISPNKQTLMSEGEKSYDVDILKNLSELYPKDTFKSNILKERVTQTVDTQYISKINSKLKNCTPKRSSLHDLDILPSISKSAIRDNKEFIKRKAFDDISSEERLHGKTAGTPSKKMKYTEKTETLQFGKTSDANDMKDREPKLAPEDDLTNVIFDEWPLEKELVIASNKQHDLPLNTARSERNVATESNFKGFCTAGGKNVLISGKAQKTASRLLKTLEMDCDTKDLVDIKNEILKKNRMSTATGNQFTKSSNNVAVKDSSVLQKADDLSNVNFDEWPLKEEQIPGSQKHLHRSDIEPKTCQHHLALNTVTPKSNAAIVSSFNGFCTAGGKTVSISEKARKTASSLLKTLEMDCDTNDLLDIKNEILKKNNINTSIDNQFQERSNNVASKDRSLLQKAQDDLTSVIFDEWPLEEQQIITSQKHLHPSYIDPKTYQHNLALNTATSKNNAAMLSTFKGFCTAGGKTVLISEKAQKTASSLLKSLEMDGDANDLLDIKNEILKKNKMSTATDNQFKKRSSTVTDSSLLQKTEDYLTSAISAEWPLEEEVTIASEKHMHQSDIEPKTCQHNLGLNSSRPASNAATESNFKGFCTAGSKNVISSEKSQKADNEFNNKSNSTLTFLQGAEENYSKITRAYLKASRTSQRNLPTASEMVSIKSPLKESAAKSNVARKNILSLSKRHHRRSVSPAIGGTAVTNSPDKMYEFPKSTSQLTNMPLTPSQERLKSSNCSTPYSEQHVSCLRNMDEDFKSITWHDKSVSNVNSETTFSISRPSVEDRIRRLEMCGSVPPFPPPVSPIPTRFLNGWRPSGLRKTCSKFNKDESK